MFLWDSHFKEQKINDNFYQKKWKTSKMLLTKTEECSEGLLKSFLQLNKMNTFKSVLAERDE